MAAAGALWAGVAVACLLAGTRVAPFTVAATVAAALVLPGHAGALLAPYLGFRPGGERWLVGGVTGYFRVRRYLPPWAWTLAGGLFLAFGVVVIVGHHRHGTGELGALGVLGEFGVSSTLVCAASVAHAQAERSRLLGF